MRTTKATREWLDEVSRAEGRSLAQQVEFLVEQARLGEHAVGERLEREFGGPHNYALAKLIAHLAADIQETANADWRYSKYAYKQLRLAISTVLERLRGKPPGPIDASSPELDQLPKPLRMQLGRALALGLLDQVRLSETREEKPSVSTALRLAAELAPTLRPLLDQASEMGGDRLVRATVKVAPTKAKTG